MTRYHITLLLVLSIFSTTLVLAQENTNTNKFRQLEQDLPTPNNYRTGSGAPGHQYWQQKVDYKMSVEINDKKQTLTGSETITYTNNSPDRLDYLWLQLDQNVRATDSDKYKISTSTLSDDMSTNTLKNLEPWFEGGFNITSVTSGGQDIDYTINKTMMRIDLDTPLYTGDTYTFSIDWWYNINDRMQIGGRSGYEYFEENDNYLYTIAQYFPRLCKYNDIYGWQNKQFLGRGEFTLEFGDYEVSITVPSDHLVASTGTLLNPEDVLTSEQRNRLEQAREEYVDPVLIVTQDEAEKAEKSKSKRSKTWTFQAENIRDFAFASSRKFIWDAMAVKQSDGSIVMAMSMYPKEGNPLWELYSTKAVAHTLKWYSHYTFDYPYPVAWSINSKRIGMEYPMICFNYGRVEEDGTYSKRTKYGMISVIIHEVGHNYFPMIVNSDERQWTWMDEGLNTFVQYLAEQQWSRNYPSRRGQAHKIVDYMKGDKSNISPIMTNSESIHQFGNNAYGKPATALNILRETVMGRELFDHAFKTYSKRWMFKHPAPADFFRTMEDASAVDLDWFWRGWFYTTDHVDIAIDNVSHSTPSSFDPDLEKSGAISPPDRIDITTLRNQTAIKETYEDQDSRLIDFYSTYDPNKVYDFEREEYKAKKKNLTDAEKTALKSNKHYYQIDFSNIGGLVMPIIVEFKYQDNSTEIYRIPAEIWNKNSEKVSKVFVTSKVVSQITLDPYLETADTDRDNNYYPSQSEMSRFDVFESKQRSRPNLMQKTKK